MIAREDKWQEQEGEGGGAREPALAGDCTIGSSAAIHDRAGENEGRCRDCPPV